MIVNEFPDRIITVDGVEYLYFGGTNYLGMSTNPEFQHILLESIKKWGTAYGSSRNSNVKLSIYETAEKIIGKEYKFRSSLDCFVRNARWKISHRAPFKNYRRIFSFSGCASSINESVEPTNN